MTNEELIQTLVSARRDVFRLYEPFVALCWSDIHTARYWVSRSLPLSAECDEFQSVLDAIMVASTLTQEDVHARETLIALLPPESMARRDEERIVVHYYLRHAPSCAAERLRHGPISANKDWHYILTGWALRRVAPDVTVTALGPFTFITDESSARELWLAELTNDPDPVAVQGLLSSGGTGFEVIQSLLETLPRLPTENRAAVLTTGLTALTNGWNRSTDSFTSALGWLDILTVDERISVLMILLRLLKNKEEKSYLRHLSHPIDALPPSEAREALIEAHALAMVGLDGWTDYTRWVFFTAKQPMPTHWDQLSRIATLVGSLPERLHKHLAIDIFALIDEILSAHVDSITPERYRVLEASRVALERLMERESS